MNHPDGRLNPFDIGGRDVGDAEQLAATLYHLARDAYALNECPEDLVRELSLLRRLGTEFAEEAAKIVAHINQQRGFHS